MALFFIRQLAFAGLVSLRRSQSMGTRYYHYDGLGSTQLLTDENGNVTDSYANTAFGVPVETGAENPTINPFRFVGELGYYLDPDSGNYYVRARILDPQLARWLAEDPRGFAPGEANVYRYVGNNLEPDPSGMQGGPRGPKPKGAGTPVVATPKPPLKPTTSQVPNTKSPSEGYFFTFCCTSKKDRLSPIPGVASPTKNPIKSGPTTGNYRIYAYPTTPPTAVGAGGADTCIILVANCLRNCSSISLHGWRQPCRNASKL
jgi:RHS repeat-associated protein